MATFKNLHSETGCFSFKNQRFAFRNSFQTSDPDLTAFLASSQNWIRTDVIAEKSIEAKTFPVQEEDQERAIYLEELKILKEQATALGLSFHPKIGKDRLTAFIAQKLEDNKLAENG